MPVGAGPAARPAKQLGADASPFVPAHAQSSQQGWADVGDPWAATAQQQYMQQQGRAAWAHYQPGKGTDSWGNTTNMIITW